MRIVNGNIFDSKAYAILHQVNCQGVMGSGVAKQVREKYPKVFQKYKSACDKYGAMELLGSIQPVKISDEGQYIVNLFAQDKYGRHGRYTDYSALRNCLKEVSVCFSGASIAIPFMMSCDRGGGDWEVVSKMIEEELNDCDVTFYRYRGGNG